MFLLYFLSIWHSPFPCRTNQSYSTYPGLNLSARLGSSDYKKLICADVCVYSLVALWATFLLTGQTNIALAIAFLCIYFKLQTRLARAKLFALQIVYTFNTADRHTFVQRFDFFLGGCLKSMCSARARKCCPYESPLAADVDSRVVLHNLSQSARFPLVVRNAFRSKRC